VREGEPVVKCVHGGMEDLRAGHSDRAFRRPNNASRNAIVTTLERATADQARTFASSELRAPAESVSPSTTGSLARRIVPVRATLL